MSSPTAPEALQQVLLLLEGEQRVTAKGQWTNLGLGRWCLLVEAELSVSASKFIQQSSGWYLVVSFVPAKDSVAIFPCPDKGPTATFPHQLHNGRPEGKDPWRTGKLCLDRPEAAFNRGKWTDEPADMAGKIVWHLSRLLLWIDAAASGTLRQIGDPFEVPPSPKNFGYPVIGFDEATSGLQLWLETDRRWGSASLVDLPGQGNRVVSTFYDPSRKPLKAISWGAWSDRAVASAVENGVWLRLDRMPVVGPWGLPTTWRELDDLISEHGFDLGEILHFAGVRLRTRTHKTQDITLLLGFPVEERVGDTPSRLHWLAITSVPVQHRGATMKGFRSNETTRQMLDRAVAQSPGRLNWTKTMNWSADQLRRRGAASAKLVSARIVLLGAGALGGAVAENLLRMGNRDLTILDGERLEIGNLTRHVLGLEAAGRNKAQALASALNLSMIDGRAVGHAMNFPPTDTSVIETLRSADIVIDCTGADLVLQQMADFEWRSEKTFVSLAITWMAEGLLAFSASGVNFPYQDAMERLNGVEAPNPDPSDSTMEGVGCWHPIFPATAADMRLWAAFGTRFIQEAINTPGRRLSYYRQEEDGQINLVSNNV